MNLESGFPDDLRSFLGIIAWGLCSLLLIAPGANRNSVPLLIVGIVAFAMVTMMLCVWLRRKVPTSAAGLALFCSAFAGYFLALGSFNAAAKTMATELLPAMIAIITIWAFGVKAIWDAVRDGLAARWSRKSMDSSGMAP